MVFELSNILTIVLVILSIFGGIIFFILNPPLKVKYDKKIPNKTPSDDPPAFVNSFFASGVNMKIGAINIKSFYLTILDLINRKYISVKVVTKEEKIDNNQKIANKRNKWKIFQNEEIYRENKKFAEKIILKINKQNIDKLDPFEKNVLRCLETLEYQGNINILNTKDLLYKRLKVNTFQKNYDEWIKNFFQKFLDHNDPNLVNNRWDTVFRIYGLLLLLISVFSFIFSYLDGFYLNLIVIFPIGILGILSTLRIFENLRWTTETKRVKVKWSLFKHYYNKDLKKQNHSQEFLDNGINYIPYLLAMGVPKDRLLNTFSQASELTDTYFFLKYVNYSLVANIVKDFLAADGSFDPKYYNTSGNFVPGYGL